MTVESRLPSPESQTVKCRVISWPPVTGEVVVSQPRAPPGFWLMGNWVNPRSACRCLGRLLPSGSVEMTHLARAGADL